MYIKLVRRIIEEAIESFAISSGKIIPDLLSEIREHIDATEGQHRQDIPDISYHDPLCRLGYLYRHATANAYLFELALSSSGDLRKAIRKSADARLGICAIGGGPGTELLGLAKFLMKRPQDSPKKICFTILDLIPEWAETWQHLADAVEEELARALVDTFSTPTIVPAFLPHDVVLADSYKNYAYQFRSMNIFVFNYLFSENKTRLRDARGAVQHMYSVAPSGSVFVVIDRLERNTTFVSDITTLFKDVTGSECTVENFNGTLPTDEQTVNMGQELSDVLGYPRVKFFTPQDRRPAAFWFTVTKV